MQVQPQAYGPPLHHLQQAQQALASAADYELKKRYLALLPPQQIIEICLTFDLHVPPYIKSTIWPVDLGAAIGAMQSSEQSTPQADNNSTRNNAKKNELPIMDSLLDPSAEHQRSRSSSPEPRSPAQAQPSQDKSKGRQTTQDASSPPISHHSPSPSTSTSAAGTSSAPPPASSPVPVPSVSAPSQPIPRPTIPTIQFAPYAYPGQPPYPHAPYYPPPTQWGAYPHLRYPPFAPYPHGPHIPGFPPLPPPSHPHPITPPVAPPAAAKASAPATPVPTAQTAAPAPASTQAARSPAAPSPAPAPTSTPAPAPTSPSTPVAKPSTPAPEPATAPASTPTPAPAPAPAPAPVPVPPDPPTTISIDDLPSYEDMIVEVLSTLGEDPEGLAPKDLWTQIASRYPVQPNFRPSAAQALQKAFKKHRLQKNEKSGRYRLNPEWKGGSTTRRNTRRPQFQGSSTPAAPLVQVQVPQITRPPPFTKVPLIRNGSVPPVSSGQPSQGWFSGGQASTSITVTATVPEPSTSTADDDAGDPFEAAQHILNLLRMETTSPSGDTSAPNHGTAPEQNAAIHNGPTLIGGEGAGLGYDENVRAELQAQLALLAVQLGEIMQDSAPLLNGPVVNGPPPIPSSHNHEEPAPQMDGIIPTNPSQPSPPPASHPQSEPQPQPPLQPEELPEYPMMDNDSDDEDMYEVIV